MEPFVRTDNSENNTTLINERDQEVHLAAEEEVVVGIVSSADDGYDSDESSELPPPPDDEEEEAVAAETFQNEGPADEDFGNLNSSTVLETRQYFESLSDRGQEGTSVPHPSTTTTTTTAAPGVVDAQEIPPPVDTTEPATAEPPMDAAVTTPTATTGTGTSMEEVPTSPSPVPPANSFPFLKDLSKYKTKIAARLAQAMQAAEESDAAQKRSPDLVPLTREYQIFRKQLRKLITAIVAYRKSTQKMEQDRIQLFQDFAAMSMNTPLHDHLGKVMEADEVQSIEQQQGDVALATTAEGLELQNTSVPELATQYGALSLASIQQMAAIHEKASAAEYQQYIVDYASEWEQIVTTTIDEELLIVQKLQRDRVHYENKVAGLRKKTNSIEQRGKEIPLPTMEKLVRNERKLKDSWESHEHKSSQLCVLIEQATEQGWKDLYPLVRNALRWEVNRIGRETMSYGKFPATLDAMKQAPGW